MWFFSYWLFLMVINGSLLLSCYGRIIGLLADTVLTNYLTDWRLNVVRTIKTKDEREAYLSLCMLVMGTDQILHWSSSWTKLLCVFVQTTMIFVVVCSVHKRAIGPNMLKSSLKPQRCHCTTGQGTQKAEMTWLMLPLRHNTHNSEGIPSKLTCVMVRQQ